MAENTRGGTQNRIKNELFMAAYSTHQRPLMLFQTGQVPTECLTWLAINGNGYLAPICPTPTNLTMAEKTKIQALFAQPVEVGTIQVKKK
jgi:hypothetical protein